MKYIAYYRVSTKRQGKSGLGLAAQEQMIQQHIAAHGGELVAAYTEIESGKVDDRPELAAAIHHADLIGGRLLVGKLDRISRDLHFITSLQKSHTEFTVCDMPNCDSFTINIYGALAQREREMISSRVKDALDRKKAWYKANEADLKAAGLRHRLGTDNLDKSKSAEYRQQGVAAIKAAADSFAAKVLPTIQRLQGEGMGLRQTATELNRQGIKTARGKEWTPTAVKNIIARI